MKYDAQLAAVKNILPGTQNILIALAANSDIDKLAAGLSLFLILEAAGKNVTIVCDDTIRVGQAHLFGIDHVGNSIPPTNAGNLVLSLEGVASSNGTIPALEKLDWYAENNNLNLVFHVLPGQNFQPVKITPQYQTGGFGLVFTIGAGNLASLGNVYQQNQQALTNAHIVNIDNQGTNANFGQTNVIDTMASSVSEIISNIITDLGFITDGDTATNLLAGIFDATKSLTDPKVNADTYMAVGNCLKAGGRKPDATAASASSQTPVFGSQFFQNMAATGPQPDLSALMPQDSQPAYTPTPTVSNDYINPSVVNSVPVQSAPVQPTNNTYNQQSSPEERPSGEGVISETPEPDWLTPKIFKGTQLG